MGLWPLQALLKSFSSLKDVGIVQVKVLRAEGLMAADVTGNQHNPASFLCTLAALFSLNVAVLQVKVIRSACWS